MASKKKQQKPDAPKFGTDYQREKGRDYRAFKRLNGWCVASSLKNPHPAEDGDFCEDHAEINRDRARQHYYDQRASQGFTVRQYGEQMASIETF